MTATAEKSTSNPKVWTIAAGTPAALVGIVVTAVLTVVLGLIGLIVGLVITVVAVVMRVRAFPGPVEAKVLATLPTRPAVGDDAAGLRNLVEGLSAAVGVPVPALLIIDEPSINVCTIGLSPERSTVVVTEGVLGLGRIAMEGVVARALVQIRQGDLAAATMATRLDASPSVRIVASMLGATAQVDDPDRDVLIDRAAVSLTRYPPGLVTALEAAATKGAVVRSAAGTPAVLWMIDPAGAEHDRLDLRIEALGLL